MLVLDDVTLCCIDTANQRLALRALERSRADIRFNRTLLLTDRPENIDSETGIDVMPIAPLRSRDDYSHFVLKSLLRYIATPHVLLVQWDGYVTNAGAWEAAFLDCDYIGAKWYWHDDGMRVGNGGFSLRSRRLLRALQDPRITVHGVEDETICRTFRPLLEREFGIQFADEALADRFAFEASYPIGQPFGFHGLFNFCRVVPPGELASLADELSDAVARSPQLAQLLRNCVALGQWRAAAAIARRIVAAQPQNEQAHALLAQAEANAARAPAANRNDPCPCGSGKRYKHCHGAIDTNATIVAAAPTTTADTLVAQAIQAHQRGELATAESGYRAALALSSDHPYALHYLGVIKYQQNEPSQALPLLERAVERVPHEVEFHNNLGLALAALDRTNEAMTAYRRALALEPDHAVAWNNLGLTLQATNALPAAIEAFRQALTHAPDFAQAHWNLGLALLAAGAFAEGWREYEWRLQIDELGKYGRAYIGPRWDGMNPAGKTILLTREQGFGDALQFARFASPLAEQGARVLIEAQPALSGLLVTVAGVAGVYGPGDSLPPYDAHLPLLSLAGALGVTPLTIPHDVPYVTADRAHVAALTRLLEPYRNTLKVGLSWAGARNHPNDRRRSCPLAAMAPLLEASGVSWFSLQKDDGENELAGVPSARALIALDARNDFDRKAALISLLDLVISVDTGNAHLAGSLARPLWLLLPFAADWRWQVSRIDSPWYPTARLFRQPRAGDWDAVIADVRRALADRLAGRK